jgi:hypothetical protein
MGYPRSLLVDAIEPGTYHCVSEITAEITGSEHVN